MTNLREAKRRGRLNRIKLYLESAKKQKTKIDKEYLIAQIMDEFAISRRIAKEDIEAMDLIITSKALRKEMELEDVTT